MIVSTTIASVILLFGKDNEPVTFNTPTLAVVMLPVAIVELLTVVVVNEVDPLNELVPVKVLLPVRVAKVDVLVRLLNDRPIIFEPVKFTVPF